MTNYERNPEKKGQGCFFLEKREKIDAKPFISPPKKKFFARMKKTLTRAVLSCH